MPWVGLGGGVADRVEFGGHLRALAVRVAGHLGDALGVVRASTRGSAAVAGDVGADALEAGVGGGQVGEPAVATPASAMAAATKSRGYGGHAAAVPVARGNREDADHRGDHADRGDEGMRG
jgi:hypothetical protein